MQRSSFRSAFQSRRCLIPCDGFFEWEAVAGSKRKQPWWITVGQGELCAFAGLYEILEDHSGTSRISCCLLTTEANSLVAPVHDRMPVLVERNDHRVWLSESPESARQLLRSYPSETMRRVPVGYAVGNPRHESADCVMPVGRAVLGKESSQVLEAEEMSHPSIRNR